MAEDVQTRGAAGSAVERLYVLAEAVPEGRTGLDAAAAVVAQALHLISADVGFVATAQGDEVEVRRVTRFSHEPVRLSFPLDAPYPIAETIRTQQPLFIASNHDLECRHPGLRRVMSEDHACATLPLRDERGGRVLGALNIAFEDPHEFTPEERELIDAVGAYCARALAPS